MFVYNSVIAISLCTLQPCEEQRYFDEPSSARTEYSLCPRGREVLSRWGIVRKFCPGVCPGEFCPCIVRAERDSGQSVSLNFLSQSLHRASSVTRSLALKREIRGRVGARAEDGAQMLNIADEHRRSSIGTIAQLLQSVAALLYT